MPPSNLCLSSYGLYHRLQYVTSSFRKFLLCFFDIFRSFQAHLALKKSGYPYGYPAYCVYIMNVRPQAYCLRSEIHGLSHGLKICHRHIFLTAFRVPPGIKKSGYPYGCPDFLVREMGLEPTRRNHTHLKRACLPFQHSRKCHSIICLG